MPTPATAKRNPKASAAIATNADATATRAFRDAAALRRWLEREHTRARVLLLRLYKKASGIATVSYAEALDEALCFGWIDGVRLPGDHEHYVQRFTPRGARSRWSKRNTEHIGRLVREGRMRPAGLRQVEAAKADGRWDAAYDSPANMKVPADFVAALAGHRKAAAFFATLTRANLFSIAYRLHDAKRPETRRLRQEKIIAMLARGEAFHPQSAGRGQAPARRAAAPARRRKPGS
jgi:uncharacterized protein YdeI (YjbR/CyaY-like superfamily)